MLPQNLTDDLVKWISSRKDTTPAFYYSSDVIRSGIHKLKKELGAKICFSTKANSHFFVLEELIELVDEFNVTNLLDLDRLLKFNVDPKRINWIHPVITSEIADSVLDKGVRRFVIDDERGLNLLSSKVNNLALTLRMRPHHDGGTTRTMIRFGNSSSILLDLATEAISAGHHIEALSFFVGVSGENMEEARPFISALEALAGLYAQLLKKGVTVPTINIGGGFPGSRRCFYRDHPDFFQHIKDSIHKFFGSGITVVCEPGRYIVEACMLIAAKVVADRELMGQRMVHLDVSAYQGLFETTFIDPEDKLTVGTMARNNATPANILGPIMDSFDVIRKIFMLPSLNEGDVVLLANVGAYSISYINQAEGIKIPELVKLPEELSLALSNVWYE